MSSNYLDIIRPGINTTFQDKGRDHLYHIGIPFSGAMDNRNYLIANNLVNNDLNLPVIEFAYQGPLLKYKGDKIYIVITGDIKFQIVRDDGYKIIGQPYQVYCIENNYKIDLQSTNKSVYGYISISENFILKKFWGSFSVNTKAKIGSNNGEKITNKQKVFDFELHPSDKGKGEGQMRIFRGNTYPLLEKIKPRTILDIGGNIGTTISNSSTWYPFGKC